MFRAETYINQTLHKIDFGQIRKHPNILIAARLWDDDRYRAAKVCYRFMRTIDDLIDDRKADSETLSCLDQEMLKERVNEWMGCLKKPEGDDPMLAETLETILEFKIPLTYFHNFARSMIYDIGHNGFSTYDDFLAYAEGASNGPASVFLHLCCLRQFHGGYTEATFDVGAMARPCALFSYLVHIIRDFRKDQQCGLNYFAEDIMEKNGLTYDDLRTVALEGKINQGFRSLVRFYYDRADEYRQQTLKVLDALKGRIEPKYFLSLRVIFELYLQTFEKIDPEHGMFTEKELNPSPDEIRERLIQFAGSADIQ